MEKIFKIKYILYKGGQANTAWVIAEDQEDAMRALRNEKKRHDNDFFTIKCSVKLDKQTGEAVEVFQVKNEY